MLLVSVVDHCSEADKKANGKIFGELAGLALATLACLMSIRAKVDNGNVPVLDCPAATLDLR
jgi:hypothetical protein